VANWDDYIGGRPHFPNLKRWLSGHESASKSGAHRKARDQQSGHMLGDRGEDGRTGRQNDEDGDKGRETGSTRQLDVATMSSAWKGEYSHLFERMREDSILVHGCVFQNKVVAKPCPHRHMVVT